MYYLLFAVLIAVVQSKNLRVLDAALSVQKVDELSPQQFLGELPRKRADDALDAALSVKKVDELSPEQELGQVLSKVPEADLKRSLLDQLPQTLDSALSVHKVQELTPEQLLGQLLSKGPVGQELGQLPGGLLVVSKRRSVDGGPIVVHPQDSAMAVQKIEELVQKRRNVVNPQDSAMAVQKVEELVQKRRNVVQDAAMAVQKVEELYPA